ncbi:cation-transporting P-type ATPase [Aetokthonos hydrillicola Thurmond2011]|jgi:Ca2+-transporting ATPase|uniref:Cation-transporting P-type ATPase n=1 Tax=Aetokthonos hydrillicola Thurmond2011 TaxID=2712845 RepID=A0AAP5I6G4_9CYAN|nr:cation-transporting P-type ATPase [Aetokthonos hydrillicola]MBO3460940.1 cation-transporting P-type ATPase [Aetokthonos hydrillicola CCALA 1050]MBW4583611.1 cation-transporting P-type ATPase [Aetokthonos hydrillicola CCALA 1050]MDR9895696.1 cation-transporting P-type ATPase [Aetokthonos hydrillicola Thurmond2011]
MSSNSNTSSTTAWYSLDVEHTLLLLESDAVDGLTSEEVEHRLEQYGTNELETTGDRSAWTILLDQFTNIMLLMLISVAVISAILDLRTNQFPKDAIAIFSIVILNGVLGYLQESRAEKALAALKRLAAPIVKVVRNGKLVEVPASNLVPGDVMFLEAGVQIAADGRLIEESNLQIRESTLTGEAAAVNKQADLVLSSETPLGDRQNMVFQGTEVLIGRGKFIVTSTGMQTELGRIAAMLQSVETEPTPLQKRLSQLGNVLVMGSLVLVAIVVIGGTFTLGLSQLEDLLEVSLSIAVAIVPESLPAVITFTLALSTQRMVRRQALIRKLPAVETLGSINTICSDKTGTLTQNKMVVQEVDTPSYTFHVTGDGYVPIGEFLTEPKVSGSSDSITSETLKSAPISALLADQEPELVQLLIACVLCNDSVLQYENNEWSVLGDPTEGALIVLGAKKGVDKDPLSRWLPRVAEFPFSSERKRMSTICETEARDWESPYVMFTKGSAEIILERSTRYKLGHGTEPMTKEQRASILKQNNQMAANGLRVLGVACKPLETLPLPEEDEATEQNLVWLGLVGMLDAPRLEAKSAVSLCQQAGIRTVMITGDHHLTAMAIASQLGIANLGDNVLTGQDLQQLSQRELEQQVDQVTVFARVAPEHKLRIVQALQKRGKLVAMTGDGVNDAPALKQADIGIAMGITGTDVSKEASDMVLLNDNFATIVAAVEEGRVVYANIRRFIKYILGSNVGEVLTIAAAPLMGLGGVPLAPLQILWMNLVTDGLPALALAVEPAEPDVMRQPPFSPRESIFSRGLGSYIFRTGVIFAIITIALMWWAYNHTHAAGYQGDKDAWKTMVFTSLCLAQMGHALAVRSHRQLSLELNPFSNPYLIAAVTLTIILQLMLVYIEPMRNFFGTHWLSPVELAICVGFSALMFVWIECEKLFIRWYKNRG